MAEKSEISWTDATFSPWIGCTKVGPGCDHCYAEALMDKRFGKVIWGVGAERVRTGEKNWNLPKRWNAEPFFECSGCGWRNGLRSTQIAEFGRDFAIASCPACGDGVLKPARRRVFCSSLADVFDNAVDPAWRADLFDLIYATPNLDWLLLTKRIGNVIPMAMQANVNHWLGHGELLPPNVWLGATIVNQGEADRDIPKLLDLPARVRFLSIEPMLGPIDLDGLMAPRFEDWTTGRLIRGPRDIDWVIAGGESGPHARPAYPVWLRSLRDQCAAAGVPFHFKQWGEWAPGQKLGALEYSWGDGSCSYWSGKKVAGRLLDGMQHDAFPV